MFIHQVRKICTSLSLLCIESSVKYDEIKGTFEWQESTYIFPLLAMRLLVIFHHLNSVWLYIVKSSDRYSFAKELKETFGKLTLFLNTTTYK
jgi:hypothetical protein